LVTYDTNRRITAEEFVDVLRRSTLGERRPLSDRECIDGMVTNASLTITAWDGEKLVGVSRSVTDFHYACYLSDLAVDVAYQRAGIGRELIRLTKEQLGPRCKIRLLAAPASAEYYPKIGFVKNERCWEL
jgi:predicted N-acetyltransferase YhbS